MEKYYRLTNKAEVHRGLQYHDGLNVDPVEFSPVGSCSAGGMYFFSSQELKTFYIHVSVSDVAYHCAGAFGRWKAQNGPIYSRSTPEVLCCELFNTRGAC